MEDFEAAEVSSTSSASSRRQSVNNLASSLLSTCNSISSALSSYCEPPISYPAPRGSPRRARHGTITGDSAGPDDGEPTVRARPRLARKRSHSTGDLLSAYANGASMAPMRQEHIVTGAANFDDFGALPSLSRWRSNGSSSASSDIGSPKSVTFLDSESSGYASSESSSRPHRSDIPRRRSCLRPSPSSTLPPVPIGARHSYSGSSFNSFGADEAVETIRPRLVRLNAGMTHSASSKTLLAPHHRSQSHPHPLSRSPSPCPSLSSSSEVSSASSIVTTPDIEQTPTFPTLPSLDSYSFNSSPRRHRTSTGGSTTRGSRRGSEVESVPGARRTFLGDFGVYVEESDDTMDDASFFGEDEASPTQEKSLALVPVQEPSSSPTEQQSVWLPRIVTTSFGLRHAWRYIVSAPEPAVSSASVAKLGDRRFDSVTVKKR